MSYDWDPAHLDFAAGHTWAVLATGRRDGSPQLSMVGYTIDNEGRIVVSAKTYTAKWRNALRQPKVSLTVPDGRVNLVVYGDTEPIETDPLRAELTASKLCRPVRNAGTRSDIDRSMLDEQPRTVLRITPTKTLFHA